MKVAILLFNMPLSKVCGSSRFVEQTAKVLAKRGHTVVVVANKEEKESQFIAEGYELVQVETPPYGSWPNCLKNKRSFVDTVARYVDSLLDIRRKYGIEILHSHHLLFSTLVASLFKDLSGVPFVATCHGTETYESIGNPQMQGFFKYANNASKLTSASIVLLDEIKKLTGIPKSDIAITNPAVDTKSFRQNPNIHSRVRRKLSIERDDVVVMFGGRFIREKGVLELPSIFQRLYNKSNKFKFLLVGDGPDRKTVEKLVDQTDLPERSCVFTGFVKHEEMVGYYNASDFFIMPSLWKEPFATSALEAMACGSVVITNSLGGIPKELESRGFSQLVCTSNDEFPTKITELSQNPNLMRQLSGELQKTVKTSFTWEKCVDVLETVYREALYAEKN